MSTEQIQESFRKPHDLSRLLYYKNMAHEQLWLECAQKLTTVIQQIIEFAKMVPGFMKLSQDDQIVLLKAGWYLFSETFLLISHGTLYVPSCYLSDSNENLSQVPSSWLCYE